MPVDTSCFGAGAGISSEYFLDCKPVFCSTAHCPSAKATTQWPRPQRSHCRSLLTQAWTHTPLQGGDGSQELGLALHPSCQRGHLVFSVPLFFVLAKISVRWDFSFLPVVFEMLLLFCWLENHHFLPVRLNLSIKHEWNFVWQKKCASLVTGLSPSIHF